MSGKNDSTTQPDAAATAAQNEGEKQAQAADAASRAQPAKKERSWWEFLTQIPILGDIIKMIYEMINGEGSASAPATTESPATARTLQQEITDVTTALGVKGQSGALQDTALSDDQKNTLKTELQQVRTALPGTMTDEARQAVAGMLEKLVQGGVQDADAILGQSITDLRAAVQPAVAAGR